jgi:hypothetical protein
MTLSLRVLALSTALGLTFSPALADVNIRYLASQGGLSAHELAAELGYFETGIRWKTSAMPGVASLAGGPCRQCRTGSAATAAVLNSIAAGNDFSPPTRQTASTTTHSLFLCARGQPDQDRETSSARPSP